MNDDENDLQAQQHADTKRRTDQLLERHKQRIQKLKVTTEETEGLKEKIRAKLEEHKNLMESSNNNNNSSSNENDYSQDYNDDIYDDDEYSNINQSMNSNASSIYAPVRGQGRSGREQHDTIEDHLIARGKAKKEYMEEQRLLHSQEQFNSYPFQPQISETARSLQRTEPVEVRMAKAREERELARSKHLVNQEKVRWENQLEDRRQVARKREEQKVNLEEKKRRERQAALEESKREQKEHDRNKKSNSAIAARTNNMTLDQIKDKLEFYQKTFQEIRLATGLSSVDDIVERLNQREHYGIEMQNEIDKKRLKTEQLRNRKSELLRKMEAVKFSGTGATDFNRDMIDKLSKSQDEFVRRLKVVREEHERVEKIILEIRQSISVMAQKLVHIDVETPVSPTHNSGGGRSGSGTSWTLHV